MDVFGILCSHCKRLTTPDPTIANPYPKGALLELHNAFGFLINSRISNNWLNEWACSTRKHQSQDDTQNDFIISLGRSYHIMIIRISKTNEIKQRWSPIHVRRAIASYSAGLVEKKGLYL
jgi:hypothetical protein